MPLYTYTAWDADATRHSGVIRAEDACAARRALKRMGLYATAIAGPGTGPFAALLRLVLGRRRG